MRVRILYGLDHRAIKKVHHSKLNVVETWMLCLYSKTREKNKYIRGVVGVAQNKDKVMENRLSWCGHVQRRFEKAPVKRGTLIFVGGKKRRGSSKVTWIEIVRKDMEKFGITSEMTLNRNTWRMRAHKPTRNSLEKAWWLWLWLWKMDGCVML